MGRTRFLDDVAPARNITDWCWPSRHPLSGFALSFPDHSAERGRALDVLQREHEIMDAAKKQQ
ncbi:hypothetical protein LAJ55_15865, partial [Streptococcus pneumoniae]|uniref:hypothetical protein n=1 Tax=Streptococcus pneumoniae TaxID=1313 RepID=UPI001CBE9216